MSNIEVIGIDHGWSQMKTSNTCFNTSIKELANAPAFHEMCLSMMTDTLQLVRKD